MENTAEALKIGFGVIVFAVALTVLFRMTSLIRGTSEEVFSSIDKTTYIDYTVDTTKINQSGNEKSIGKRLVNFTDIIPAIYRYAQEGYGVTIIDGSDIVARFDLSTEAQVKSCIWKDSNFGYASQDVKEEVNRIKYSLSKYLKKNIYDVIGITATDELRNESRDGYSPGRTFDRFKYLNNLIPNIYGTGAARGDNVYTSWISSNRYSNNYITQRINCDLYGGTTYFSAQYPGVSDEGSENLGQHKACCAGVGLFNRYKNDQFIEYVTEVDQNAYIIDDDGNLTDLLQYGTIRYAKQRELIYVRKY